MDISKTLVFIITLSSISYIGHSQSIIIRKDTLEYKGEQLQAFSNHFDATVEDLEHSFVKYMRAHGNLLQKDPVLMYSEVKQMYDDSAEVYIYAKTLPLKGIHSEIRVALPSAYDDSKHMQKLQDFLVEFSLFYYRSEMQHKIKETERASAYLSKEYHELKEVNEEAFKQFRENEKQIVELEKHIEAICKMQDALMEKIRVTYHDSDSIYKDLHKIKDLTERNREKLMELH